VFLFTFSGICLSYQDSFSYVDQNSVKAIDEVVGIIRNKYIDNSVSTQKVIGGALNGMLQSLDQYSVYYSPEEYKQFRTQTGGSFGGLGIEIMKDGPFIRIISAIDDTPASKAGIKPGDLITHINDSSVVNMRLNEAVAMMRGKVGEIVNVKILRHEKMVLVSTLKKMEKKSNFEGFGIKVSKETPIRILDIRQSASVSHTDLKVDDYITHVNDVSISDMQFNAVLGILRSSPGTLRLKILRDDKRIVNLRIKRERIQIKTVKSRILGDIAIIRISSFNQETSDNLISELKSILLEKKHSIGGVVLDLRNNPGGLLEQSIEVSKLFLENNAKIVTIKRKDQVDPIEFRASDLPDVLSGMPIVVLINKGSASASEIVTGALRDNNRAVLVGERTFGKGAVQEVIPLNSISGSAVKITVALYYTPSGAKIHGIGIDPDVEVADSRDSAIIGEIFSSVRTKNVQKKEMKIRNNRSGNKTNIAGVDDDTLAEGIRILKDVDRYHMIISSRKQIRN